MIVITGATGRLGRLVISSLLKRIPPAQIVAAVRTPSKAKDLAAQGVQVRQANYDKSDTLVGAFEGANSLLLISSTDFKTRVAQHKSVIDAAKTAGVQLLAYTSILRADTSKILIAPDHLATERYLSASGMPYVFLRNSWYTENYTASLPKAVEKGTIVGSAGEGRVSSALRAEYAEAASVVLSTSGHANKIYELGGDQAFTLSELAEETARQTGRPISYKNLTEQQYEEILKNAGLPDELAHLTADSDVKVSQGELYTSSTDLSSLLSRPTSSLRQAVAAAL